MLSPSDRPDLFAPSTDTAYDITILSAYAPKQMSNASSKDARAPILRREAEKHKRYRISRLAHIGPRKSSLLRLLE